jgi:hypothetical protein
MAAGLLLRQAMLLGIHTSTAETVFRHLPLILQHNFTSRPLRLRRWRRFARTAQPRNALFGPGDGRVDLGVVAGFRPLRGRARRRSALPG